MARKHRRTWSVVRTGEIHSSSGYQASIAKIDSSRVEATVFNIVDFLTVWSGTLSGFEPRYRVLISHEASGESVGVAEGRTIRRISRSFDEVERLLASSNTHEEARRNLALDF